MDNSSEIETKISTTNENYSRITRPRIDQSSSILKLNDDCWEKIFDYMSFDEFSAISQTCKRIHQISEYYFHKHFGGIGEIWGNNNGASTSFRTVDAEQNFLHKFIHKVVVFGEIQNRLRSKLYCSLNTLKLCEFTLIDSQLVSIREVLPNIEVIQLEECVIEMDFMTFLRLCTNIKSLSICNCEFESDDYNWMRQKYPTLERFHFTPEEYFVQNDELTIFLELNPNIKRLSIAADCLWTNSNSFMVSNVHLDYLVVDFRDNSRCAKKLFNEMTHFSEILFELQARGFYKSLHIRVIYMEDEQCEEFITTLSSLETMEKLTIIPDVNISALLNLKELCIGWIHNNNNMQTLAISLIKLERVFFYEATTDDILPFIRHGARLNTIKIEILKDGSLLKNDSLDIATLNEERSKLALARKVLIFVGEKTYLATKWKTKNMNYGLVDIKRTESIEFSLKDY